MSAVLGRLGAFCARRRLLVLGVWLFVTVAAVLVLRAVPDSTTNDLTLPGTGSQAATDLLAAEFPPQQNGGSPVVFHVSTGSLTTDAATTAIHDSVTAISKLPHVHSASDPTANPQAGLISANGRTAFSTVLLDVPTGELTPELAQAVMDAAAPARAAGMQVEAGGPVGSTLSPIDTGDSEEIGILAAIVILTFTFGTLVAMAMPIGMAILALISTLAIVRLVGLVVNIASTGPTLATMIGLGVGIDYALFLVTRHRDNRRAGMANRDSVANAVATSGGAVVFAGGTVVIALLSLAVAGIPFVTSLGYATAIAVAVAVVAAITLLPALLSLVGDRIDSVRLPRWLHPAPKPEGRGFWAAWSRVVTRHRVAAVLVALAILIPLAVPVLSLRLGQEDIGTTPTSTTERRAFDLLSEDFGPGYNGPLLVAVALVPKAAPSQEYEDQYSEAMALKDSLTAESTALQAQADELQQEQAALTRKADALQQQKKQLQKQQRRLERQGAALQQQAAQLAQQEASLRAQKAQLQRERDRLRREARELRAEARRLAERLVRLRADVVRLDAEIAAATDPAERARLVAERKVAKDAIRDTRRELRRATQRAQGLLAQARTLAQRAAQLEREADALNQQAAALRSEGAELAAQADRLARQAADLQQQADELQQQGADLQAQADELNAQKEDLEAQQQQAEQLQDQITAELTKAGGDARGTDPRLVSLQDALATPSDVQLVSPPNISKSGTAATFTVIPKTRPADPVTADLVVQLRDQTLPPATEPGVEAFVGGSTAANVDLAAKISRQLPLVILTVLALSFLLLMIAFRSLLVPVQAAVTNLLTAAASFGVLTACFQWGWGLELIGLDSPYGTVPIASYVPLMMFAALFGLSMDYEVFFVSHVQHEVAAGRNVRDAVRSGLAGSAKVIAAAALIMICVFGSFVLADDPIIKQFGVGLSVAVALAGLMVLLLAPAMLALFGEHTFRIPRWLDRVLPHVDIEGDAATTNAPAEPGP